MSDPNQAYFLLEYNNICNKIQEDYKRISESNKNKKEVLKEIESLLSNYESKWNNLQILFSRVEGINWSEARKGFNTDTIKFTKLRWKVEGVLCPRCQQIPISHGLKYCYDCQKKVWESDRREREKEQKKLKLTNCSICSKKPLTFHYIYDIRTKQLERSESNATDANNQWLFCSEEHFEEWHKKNYFCCAECIKEFYSGKYKYKKTKKDGKKFCSDECCNSHYAENCDKCAQKVLGNTYYSDTKNKTGVLCSKCHNEYTCKECGINKEGRYWYHTIKNDNKKFCSDECFNNHYLETCVNCQKKVSNSYHDKQNPELTYCLDCHQEAERQGKELEKSTDNPRKAIGDLIDEERDVVENDEDKDNNNNPREREREREQIQQSIRELEQKSKKTPEEIAELEELRKKLQELENLAKKPTSTEPNNSAKPWLIPSLAIAGVLLTFCLVLVFIRQKKKNK